MLGPERQQPHTLFTSRLHPIVMHSHNTALEARNLTLFAGHHIDTIVLGLVWYLPRLTASEIWAGDGAWQWIVKTLGDCKLSFGLASRILGMYRKRGRALQAS